MSHDLTPKEFARLAEHFDRLVELGEPARRRELAALEESEPLVHQKLVAMLAAQTTVDAVEAGLEEMIESPPFAPAAEGQSNIALTGGSVIEDRYRLLAPLGTGGMGEVWSAEQLEPVARRVALKILRQESTSRTGATRMRSERQALATMDHPNIATVYDGGELEDGTPYFVMELVPDGLPITAYCQRHSLGLEERLRLMLRVCSAVEHAHQKRIIHRDLKPSNVLICEPGEGSRRQQPIVKVIDFGIAKPLADEAIPAGATRIGELVGTPEYMSPEQASLGAMDIDTRSDVYALGLMLFELLVGELPLAGEPLHVLPIDEQCRRIREQEAPRPSTRMRRQAAGARQLDDAAWRRVRGDLDRIVLTALAKDREHRYRSAAALADDLERYLNHQPILVAPQTLRYHLGKFVRRHRVAVAFSGLAMAAIAVALAGIAFGWIKAQRAEALARTEATTTRKISEFLEGLLREGNPEEAEGADSVRGLLDRGAERVRTELTDEPVVRARLMLTIADAYRALGQYEPAIELADESVAAYRSVTESNPEDVAAALEVLTHVLMNSRQHERALLTAEEHHQVQKKALGESHPDVAVSLFQLGTAHWHLGDFEQAREKLEIAVELRSSADGPMHESLPRLQNNLAILYWQLGRMDDAERLYREALASLRSLRGPDHPHVASTLNNLALVFEQKGEFEKAIEIHRQALALRQKIFEAPHPDLAESLNNIGNSLTELGRHEEAREILERALADRRAIFGEGANDLVASTLFNLAKVLPEDEQERAESLFQESLSGFEASLGSEHPTLAFPLLELGNLEFENGRPHAALSLLRRAAKLRRDGLPAGHNLLEVAEQTLCDALDRLGRQEEWQRQNCALYSASVSGSDAQEPSKTDPDSKQET